MAGRLYDLPKVCRRSCRRACLRFIVAGCGRGEGGGAEQIRHVFLQVRLPEMGMQYARDNSPRSVLSSIDIVSWRGRWGLWELSSVQVSAIGSSLRITCHMLHVTSYVRHITYQHRPEAWPRGNTYVIHTYVIRYQKFSKVSAIVSSYSKLNRKLICLSMSMSKEEEI